MKGTDALRNAMLIKFDCIPSMNGDSKSNKKREDRKRTAEKVFLIFQSIRPYAGSREQAIRLVRYEWTYGMNPLVAWVAWLLVKNLVELITVWLWGHYEEPV